MQNERKFIIILILIAPHRAGFPHISGTSDPSQGPRNIADPFLINNQLDAQFLLYVFISILYVFRRTLCSSSGESIVSIQHLVYVSLCR